MKQHLEPTYLRYIYDGLVKGSIHPENAAELPEGLIGLYEEAFDERTSVVERQKLLERFAIWALLKKEVSAVFVAEVLGETEDEIQGFISNYSAWFNSPESGKYQLYHERLKVYLLQKLSEGELYGLHEKLISRLEQAIEEQKADEFEWYGLEFLGGHLGVSAMLNGDGQKLLNLAYAQTHWQRQLKISKDYNWTKSGLHSVMTWASKYNDDEVIECGLQMVDLYHQEQNAAPQIVILVTEGDFDTALKRIEQFGGNDKEGLQRKFILYMLCLMELTLLESKDKPFRKEGIEKLLKHLDEQLPVDHSILNWNDFFPSYLVFQIANQLENLEYDTYSLFARTQYWDIEWINEKGPFTEFHFTIFKACVERISQDAIEKNKYIKIIAVELSKQGFLNEARNYSKQINDQLDKDYLNSEVVRELAKLGKIDGALEFLNFIVDRDIKIKTLTNLVSEFTKNGYLTETYNLISAIEDRYDYCRINLTFATQLAIKGNTIEAETLLFNLLEVINNLKKNNEKLDLLLMISSVFFHFGKKNKSKEIVLKVYSSFDFNMIDLDKNIYVKKLCIGLVDNGMFKESISLAYNVKKDSDKIEIICEIYTIATIIGEQKKYDYLLDEIFEILNQNLSRFSKEDSTILEKYFNREEYCIGMLKYCKYLFHINHYLLCHKNLHLALNSEYSNLIFGSNDNLGDLINSLNRSKDDLNYISILNLIFSFNNHQANNYYKCKNSILLSSAYFKCGEKEIAQKLLENSLSIASEEYHFKDNDYLVSMIIAEAKNQNNDSLQFLAINEIKSEFFREKRKHEFFKFLSFNCDYVNFIKHSLEIIRFRAISDVSKRSKFLTSFATKTNNFVPIKEDDTELVKIVNHFCCIGEFELALDYANVIKNTIQRVKQINVILSKVLDKDYNLSKGQLFKKMISSQEAMIFDENFLKNEESFFRDEIVDKIKSEFFVIFSQARYKKNVFGKIINQPASVINKILIGLVDKKKVDLTLLINYLIENVITTNSEERYNIYKSISIVLLKIKDLNHYSNLYFEIIYKEINLITNVKLRVECLLIFSTLLKGYGFNLKSIYIYRSIIYKFNNIQNQKRRNEVLIVILVQLFAQQANKKFALLIEKLELNKIPELINEILKNSNEKLVLGSGIFRILNLIHKNSNERIGLKLFLNGFFNQNEIWVDLIYCLISAGKTQRTRIVRFIIDNFPDHKDRLLEELSCELFKINREESLDYSSQIESEIKYNWTLRSFSIELAKENHIEESLEYAESINILHIRDAALSEISLELLRQNEYTTAVKTVLEISSILERQLCWNRFGSFLSKSLNKEKTISVLKKHVTNDSKPYYLQGLLEEPFIFLNDDCLFYQLIHIFLNDISSLNIILENQAIFDIFFSRIKEKTQRFNRTLNLQWAIDIKNQLPN